jgi:hypothetical protein
VAAASGDVGRPDGIRLVHEPRVDQYDVDRFDDRSNSRTRELSPPMDRIGVGDDTTDTASTGNTTAPPQPAATTTAAPAAGLSTVQGIVLGVFTVAAVGFAWHILSREHAGPRRAGEEAAAPERCPTGSKVQTLIFSRDHFTQAQALGWARDHGFRAQKIDVEPNTLRVRQESPTDFERMRTITLRPGVKAVVGWKRC